MEGTITIHLVRMGKQLWYGSQTEQQTSDVEGVTHNLASNHPELTLTISPERGIMLESQQKAYERMIRGLDWNSQES